MKQRKDRNQVLFSPGRAGILSRTGGATASEMLTVTMVTKLVVVSRAIEQVKESSASQTTGLLVSPFGDLGNGNDTSVCFLSG